MAWKNIKQKSLADALLVEHAALTELDDVHGHGLLDWSRLEEHLLGIHNKVAGEKAWSPLMMFKALLLQSWYKLRPTVRKAIGTRFTVSSFCWVRLRPKRTRPQYAVALPPKVSGWAMGCAVARNQRTAEPSAAVY